MENEEKNNVKNDKKKDNKVLRIVLKILFLIAVAVVIISICMLTYKVIIVKKIMDNNVDVYLGNNYKIITTYKDAQTGENNEEITYYKDGISKKVAGNGMNCLLRDENSVYIYSMKDMMYYDVGNETIGINLNERFNLLMNIAFGIEDVDSIWEIVKIAAEYNIREEIVDNKEYIVLSVEYDAFDVYINKETYRCEMCQGVTQRVEIGTVTDEDMKRPWELGLTKGETNNN